MDLFIDSDLVNALGGPVSRRSRDLILSTTGPVVEKAGFFPAHIKDAWAEYKAAPKEEQDGFTTYLKGGLKRGGKSLLEDILIHDPLYVAMMMGGLHLWPGTPPVILSVSSFIAAVGIVAVAEVTATEALYHRFKRNLKKRNFGTEKYLESRFLISKEKDPQAIIDTFMEVDEFGLSEQRTAHYHDRYLDTSLPIYNGRTPRLRIRRRDREEGGHIQTAQIIYKKATELAQKNPEQFRYFPQEKQKLYFMLDQEMPESLEEIEDPQARRILQRAQASERTADIEFERTVANNPETLLISTDKVHQGNSRLFYVAEVKVYKDTGLLRKAMRLIMNKFPVVQTTYGKQEIALANTI